MQLANSKFNGAQVAARVRNRNKGFSLVEIAIVVVIVGLMLAGALSYVRTVMADNRANDELKELPTVVTRIQKLYANRPNFTGATTAIFISNDVFPKERVSSTTVATNRWGGTITAAPATIGTTNDSIALTYNGVRTPECLAVVPQVESTMRRITVGGTTVKADGALTDFAALGTACATASEVVVVYTFSK